MKNKLFNFLKITLVLSSIILFSVSCTKDKWYDSTNIYFEPYTIRNTDWVWNDNNSRYEYIKSFPNLTSHMYDNGVINASVFLYDGSVEVQTPLPYIKTWNENGIIYTETLSFDISYDDRTILYYIQASDMKRTDQKNIPNYEIKVSIISRN